MSLSLLLEKYDVSTDEGLQKALSEIEKEEAEVDEALSGALSRACNIEGRLRTASQAYTKLNEVKADSQDAAVMVDKTAALAKDVSAKVRQLDLARSRVAECQRRVNDLIDLQLCSAGVEAAIKAHDYETGAAHVARFLGMDPGSVAAARARGAPDPRAAMTRAADTLREHLVRKFEEAARKDDAASVERLFKLFPQIGRAEEGVDLLAKYVAAQTEVAIRRACTVSDTQSEAAVFADALTRVLEAAAAGVERCRRAAARATGLLPRACRHLQPTVCLGARRVYRELVANRRIEPDHPARAPLSPLAAEPALVELALAHNTVTLYFTFLRRKTEADASSLSEEGKKACMDAIEKIIAECDLTRTAQDLLGHYLALERYFLEENVNKALKMATPQTGATTSSLVDDIFFIARKAIRRCVSTGSVEGVCVVLNEAGALVERGATQLRRWLRAPQDVLPFPPPPASHAVTPAAAVLDAAGSLATRLNRDVDAQRDLFLAYANEAEAGGEWAERLASEACAEAEPLIRSAGDRAKLQSCAAGLGAAAAAYRAASDLARDALLAALKPRAHAWADHLADPGHDPEEMEEDADALPGALDVLADAARSALPARLADAVLLALLQELAARAEARLRAAAATRAGGLLAERRARRLAGWAGCALPAARERLARLTQACALLALERVSHAPQALSPAARLPPDVVRELLSRRTDFKIEEIKRLKL